MLRSPALKSGGSQFKLNQAARGKLFLSSLYGVPIFRSKIVEVTPAFLHPIEIEIRKEGFTLDPERLESLEY